MRTPTLFLLLALAAATTAEARSFKDLCEQFEPLRNYRLLETLRHEWDEAMGRQSLIYRVMVPRTRSYQVLFEPGKGANAEIRLPTGTRKVSADDKGDLRIPFEDSWIAANPTIVLSEMPKKIGLAFD